MSSNFHIDKTGLSRRTFLSTVTLTSLVLTGGWWWRASNLDNKSKSETSILLPEGLKIRVIARSGETSCQNSDHKWHSAPDGGGCFKSSDGGWIYASNSEETGRGGVSVLSFDAKGRIIDSYPILSNTNKNCGGSITHWGTWLSCEETNSGRVWECDPYGSQLAIECTGLGIFKHESTCVDPETSQIYLTEDQRDGCLYRFTPTQMIDEFKPDLTIGVLEVAKVTDGNIDWKSIPDSKATSIPLRYQVADAQHFKGGEGITMHGRELYFTTKHDNKIWLIDLNHDSISTHFDAMGSIGDVDAIESTASGNLLIAEDGRAMRVMMLHQSSKAFFPVIQLSDHTQSEITGLSFDPWKEKLYFSSQRGDSGNNQHGVTFEVSGSFDQFLEAPELIEQNF
jgi:uncharacterized protein